MLYNISEQERAYVSLDSDERRQGYMKAAEKRLTINDLQSYRGKRVTTRQLKDILDMYIILTDVKIIKNMTGSSTVEGILDSYSDTYIELSKPNSTLVYNNSLEREKYCEYEY